MFPRNAYEGQTTFQGMQFGNRAEVAVVDVTQVFIDLARAETRWYNVVDERLQAIHGVSAGLYQALVVIGERPRCRVTDLVTELAISVGAASKIVDRLQSAGWCRRTVNPDDRRSSWLSLTNAGERLVAAAGVTFAEEAGRWLAEAFTANQRTTFAAFLARLRQVLEDAGVGVPGQPPIPRPSG
jgi:DNA-binding MarR family transcriptional regulator